MKEEKIAQLNFVLSFVLEVENFISLFANYKNYYFVVSRILEDNYKTKLGEEEAEKILTQDLKEQGNYLANLLTQIRQSANRIYIKYMVLKETYGFEEISQEYKKLYEKEIIDVNLLEKFTTKLAKAYYKISEKVEKLRKELEGL